MRVAVIGPTYAARVLAEELGAEIYGYPYEHSPRGPFYLWATPAVRDYLPRVPTKVCTVRWWEHGELVKMPSMDSLWAYHGRRDGAARDTPVCGGAQEFEFVEWWSLESRLKLREYRDPVHLAELRPDGWHVHNEFGERVFDALVIGTPPWVTLRYLQSFSWSADTMRLAYLHLGPPMSYYPKTPEHTLVYTGEEEWFRHSHGPGSCYCTEAPTHLPGFSDAHRVVSRVSGSVSYPLGVVPVGRFPELKEELMTHDIIEHRAEYVERVRRAAEAVLERRV